MSARWKARITSPTSGPKPPRPSSRNSKTCSKFRARRCPSVFARSEKHFVTKCFSDLANTEGHLLARNFEHVFELREDGLGGFGPEVGDVIRAFHRADIGLEHQVERA